MKIRIVFIPCLILLLAASGRSQQTVFVQGQVIAIETGLPVSQKAVSIGLYPAQPITTEYTNIDGHYAAQITVQSSDSASMLYVTVTDCNQQPVIQTFSIQNQNQIQADFQICTLPANCQALFLYRPDSLNQQLVFFENFSNPVTSSTNWSWNFGDGSFSGEFNPFHEFVVPGIYNVCLTMTDSVNLCSNVFCMEVWVNNNSGNCAALFDWNAQGLSVTFTDLSTGNPDSWLWDFGDGTSSTEPNPVHTWTVPGTYQVCLSIFNDSVQCQSTYCDFIVAGDELLDCHASYSYQQIEGTTYSFTNESTGMIFEYIWDFGDGTPTSNAANPVHTWQQAGIYNVCLAVIGIYCSDVTCTDITVGDTLSGCQAAFTALVDSIPGNINHYWFVDESTGLNISNWYWDFGDGFISYLPSVEHTFSESGTYTVCHAIGGHGNGGYCADTICTTITTPAYNNLGGQVFAGNFPINNPVNTGDTALVRLYRKSGNLLSEVATGFFYEYGYYFFLDVPEGNYVLHAGLTPGSDAFSLFLPSYSGETRHWQQSQHISLNESDVFDANVLMPGLSIPGSGPGLISGSINFIDNSSADLHERLIFLQQAGNIIAYTLTGDNGEFVFSGLPLTAYTLTAEVAGMYSQPVEVNLTETEIQALLLQVLISASGIYGIDDLPETALSDIRFYPNPASANICLAFNLIDRARIISEIYASSGIICFQAEHECSTGENNLTINVNFLSPGIYLLALKSPEGQVLKTLKFSKK